jgi:hypothetical protein
MGGEGFLEEVACDLGLEGYSEFMGILKGLF